MFFFFLLFCFLGLLVFLFIVCNTGSSHEASLFVTLVCVWLTQACDLLGVAAHERFERKGLCTLATVLVDYRGYRVVCQSVIPGEWAGSTMGWLVCETTYSSLLLLYFL